FNEQNDGQIKLQVSAAFKTQIKRVLSEVAIIPVYNLHTDTTVGVSVLFPGDLYVVAPPSGASRQFLLQSTPKFIGLGEAFDSPDPGQDPSDGYVISISSSTYTAQPFDIDGWITATLPDYDVYT